MYIRMILMVSFMMTCHSSFYFTSSIAVIYNAKTSHTTIVKFSGETCYYESSLMDAENYPLLPWIGGSSSDMTPYKCFLGCLKIDMVEKGTSLTIGVSGPICFCGHAWDDTSKCFYVKILNGHLNM